ncbi:MAG: 2-keto-4-pentenoate hydratase, partial [Acidimicrobiales bacterium]
MLGRVTPEEHEQAAAVLRRAQATRTPVGPLSIDHPGMDVTDAYQIQLHNIRVRMAEGHRVRGHKVGLSSRAMQEMMGVDEPDYGHLLDDMFVFEDTAIDADLLIQPRVEVEVAFILGAPLEAPGCNAADVLRATQYVVPALEIIDSRIADWKITLVDTIADNASSGLLVLGARATPIDRVDLRTLGATLRRNGEIIATGSTGAVLGNPVTAVAWLANKVHDFGVTLDAGHVILPGSCTRAYDVSPGDAVRADFDGLGSVAVNF